MNNKLEPCKVLPTVAIYDLIGYQGIIEIIIEYIGRPKDLSNFVLTSFIKQFNHFQNCVPCISKSWISQFFEIIDHPEVQSFVEHHKNKPVFYLNILVKSKLLHFKMIRDINLKYKSQYSHGTLKKEKEPTPFLVACEKGNLDDVKIFIKLLKIDVNQKGITSQGYSCGYTGLILAAYEEREDIVKYLLMNCIKTIDINLEDEYGSTALHYAAYNNNKSIQTINLLLKYGSIVHKKNQQGKIPLDYAKQNFSKIGQLIAEILKRRNEQP